MLCLYNFDSLCPFQHHGWFQRKRQNFNFSFFYYSFCFIDLVIRNYISRQKRLRTSSFILYFLISCCVISNMNVFFSFFLCWMQSAVFFVLFMFQNDIDD